MNIIVHKRGDTFTLDAEYLDSDGQPIDVSDYIIRSQLRDANDNLIYDFTFETADLPLGNYKSDGADTSEWPLGDLSLDIEHTYQGKTTSSSMIIVRVIEGATR